LGSPTERDKAAIGRDLLDGYVTRAAAKKDYGIADPDQLRKAAAEEDT
jgi:N-methylhydantoinase B/oxoprolinase/acetone carboxylase alpha subunit